MPIVVAFGGSVLAPAAPNPQFVLDVAKLLMRLAETRPLLVSVGGGAPARQAITAARSVHVGEEELDRIGVAATRLNAQILCSVLHAHKGQCNREPPTSIEDAIHLLSKHKIVIMGGTTPGHSTDFVAASLATAAKADRLVIATSVDGVYAEDPKTDPDAKRFESLTHDELLQIIEETEWTTAGAPGVVDGPATLVLCETKLETCVVLGTDLKAVEAAATGAAFHGTIIRSDQHAS